MCCCDGFRVVGSVFWVEGLGHLEDLGGGYVRRSRNSPKGAM